MEHTVNIEMVIVKSFVLKKNHNPFQFTAAGFNLQQSSAFD